jgi:two-component system CheB/CheR fusion protein
MPPKTNVQRASVQSAFDVVALGASAGGLEACRKFLEAVPATSRSAYILVLHLDPSHDSMMVDLLANHTALVVGQAANEQRIEPAHLYIIPPGAYLSIRNGALQLSPPDVRHGARMPFDFLLSSLAKEYGPRAACVILSGTGADGSAGLKAIKAAGGLVLAQAPKEAAYDGMPLSAIQTGLVDATLSAAEMPARLAGHFTSVTPIHAESQSPPPPSPNQTDLDSDLLNEIVQLLRAGTGHDYALYKRGTMQRRIERRMGLAGIRPDDARRYLELLRTDADELGSLARDILVKVTSFFRDPPVFELLADTVVPELLRNHPAGRPIRLWSVGCSTGEEAYSLAIVFREWIARARLNVKLQILASDADADSIAAAREGIYPLTIAEDVSPERLVAYFVQEEGGYRITTDLRSTVVFSVQDLLSDPPFSRLDMISCRNLLIYLGTEAQTRAMALFHFALNEGGLLLLGNAETVGDPDDRFALVSKSDRLYRHVGRSHPGELRHALNAEPEPRAPVRTGSGISRQTMLGEVCRRRIIDAYAPATVLINRQYACLYTLGPTADYLAVPRGVPTQSLLAMTPTVVHAPLRAAVARAEVEGGRVLLPTMSSARPGAPRFAVTVEPIQVDGETLFLVVFEAKADAAAASDVVERPAGPKAAELAHELDVTRSELRQALRHIEVAAEEQRALHQEALSVNEEYQSTNEELLASKEELQSLNEELTALNGQLQETLDRQRSLSDDLQNVLYSTDVATIFLDPDLRIRFFTPPTRALFSILPGDIGRPLMDLRSLAIDEPFRIDAGHVLATATPIEREIQVEDGTWYARRILPYRTHCGDVEGLVVTFVDITVRRHAVETQALAERVAQRANAAKSRFLAAASHDLRQPLQTLYLILATLRRLVADDKTTALIQRLEETLGVMTGMLDTLLDINQIEAGTVRINRSVFAIDNLLLGLKAEHAVVAEARHLDLRVVRSSLLIESDRELLGQMIRNLLSNALKYTPKGRILVGCRRRLGQIDIEVWDTGIGIPAAQLDDIFDEYYQVENAARQRGRGLGLGLSIVQRLGALLGHRVRVRSRPGKGSVFSIEISQPTNTPLPTIAPPAVDVAKAAHAPALSASILVVEDDADIRDLLQTVLQREGYRVATASDGTEAMEAVTRRSFRPELILADYSLPGGQDGLQVATALRHVLGHTVPVIIMSGDIAADTLRAVAAQRCAYLSKPVKLPVMVRAIDGLLREAAAGEDAERVDPASAPVVYLIDDDEDVRTSLAALLEDTGHRVIPFADAEAFLDQAQPGMRGCLLLDAVLPGISGTALLQRLTTDGVALPAIMITGHSDVGMAVSAMKAGAVDFLEKPVAADAIRAAVDNALHRFNNQAKIDEGHATATRRLAGLTPRQHQIMDLVLAGHPSKNIAADLGISQRTVENHRAAIMKRSGAKSLPELARIVLVSAG